MSITNPFPTIYSQIQFFMALFCTSSCHFNVISFYAYFFFCCWFFNFSYLFWWYFRPFAGAVCWFIQSQWDCLVGTIKLWKCCHFFRSFESCKMHSIHFKNHFHDKLSFEHILTWFGFAGAFTDCGFAHTVHCCHFQKIWW